MSGCVTVVLREPNGTTHKMLRWSGILPTVLTDPRLFADDPSDWIEDFMREWYRMSSDYDKHKRDGQYELAMTPVYLPWNEAAPSEYGIVCIDLRQHLRQRTILSMQSFCSEPVAISLQSLRCDARRAKSAEALMLSGVISKLYVRPQGKKQWTTYDIPAAADKGRAFREVVAMAESLKGEGYLPLTPAGIAITGFREGSIEQALAFKQAMADLGFEFSRKENRLWSEWVERFLYDEPDEVAMSWKAKFTGGVPDLSADDDEDDIAETGSEFAM